MKKSLKMVFLFVSVIFFCHRGLRGREISFSRGV